MPKAKLITRKPIEADAGELEENRRQPVPPSCAYWKNYKRARREHWQRGMALVTMPHSLRKAEILRYEKGGGAHGFHSSRNFN